MKRMLSLLLALLTFLFVGCTQTNGYVLNESTFFLVMTNIQYYPEQYANADIEYDCFTYELIDTDGQRHLCGVRKCSSEFGCACGKDTIIGFFLESDAPLPEPRNQSADNGDKTWVHLKGRLKGSEKKTVTVYAVRADGTPDLDQTERISFPIFSVESCTTIEDASHLNYYVTK